MKVYDVMSSSVVTVFSDIPFRELWKTIFRHHINAVPVVDKKKHLLGIITKDDIVRKLYPDYADFIEDFFSVVDYEDMEKRIYELGSMKAKDFMCRHVIYSREDTPVMRALSRMISRSVNQLPVLGGADNTLVGIVTKGDIFSSMFRMHLKKEKNLKIKKRVPKKLKR